MATEVLDRGELIDMIWQTKGKVSLAAERLGVTAQTVYNYADRYATVKNAIGNARAHFGELLVDTAEMKLQAAVIGSSAWAIKYVLDNSPQAKERGWGQDLTYDSSDDGGEDTQVVVYIPDNGRGDREPDAHEAEIEAGEDEE